MNVKGLIPAVAFGPQRPRQALMGSRGLPIYFLPFNLHFLPQFSSFSGRSQSNEALTPLGHIEGINREKFSYFQSQEGWQSLSLVSVRGKSKQQIREVWWHKPVLLKKLKWGKMRERVLEQGILLLKTTNVGHRIRTTNVCLLKIRWLPVMWNNLVYFQMALPRNMHALIVVENQKFRMKKNHQIS